MADAELIEETNRLLRTILQNDAEQKARSAEAIEEIKKKGEKIDANFEEQRKKRLRDAGLPEEAVEGTEDDWEKRRREAQRKSRENIEASQKRHERYQEELLAELRTQSDLLRQIAERLAR
jgi:hypothetical protein